MSDIVRRLYDRQVCSLAQNACRNDSRMEEAADAITALRAEVERLTRELADGSFYKESDIDALQEKAARATAAEADAAAAREQVWKLRERIDHTFEDALAMWHNPEGTLWNHGTTPTARDRAEWAAIRDTVQTLLGVLDPDRARAALQGEG